ncbi:MAG: PilZ domain-containing protein [Silvanigrellales bacterium]|jgi:hypothetical protein|nr:PilZ domain-containing protein [Silvanigrellales bacterium]
MPKNFDTILSGPRPTSPHSAAEESAAEVPSVAPELAQTLSREEIMEVIGLAREREEPVVLSPYGLDVSFFCVIADVTPEHVVLKNPIPASLAVRAREASEYGLFCRMYQLRADHLEPFGTFVKFPLPEFAELNKARQLERVHFAAKENSIVEIQHPFDTSTMLRRRVFDLSSGGMSFRARRKTPFIQPGRVLPSCQIYLQGLPYEKRRARVVYVKQIIDVNAHSFYQVGVQFIDAEEEEGT